jgi:hypothetical protein
MVLHYSVGQQITPLFDFIDANAADYAQQNREQGMLHTGSRPACGARTGTLDVAPIAIYCRDAAFTDSGHRGN